MWGKLSAHRISSHFLAFGFLSIFHRHTYLSFHTYLSSSKYLNKVIALSSILDLETFSVAFWHLYGIPLVLGNGANDQSTHFALNRAGPPLALAVCFLLKSRVDECTNSQSDAFNEMSYCAFAEWNKNECWKSTCITVMWTHAVLFLL